MRIALAQLNPVVGDVAGNLRLVKDAIDVAREQGAELVVFSEMVMLGYPPRDLILRDGVAESCEEAVRQAAEYAGDIALVIGHPRPRKGTTRPLANSLSVCADGRVVKVYDKRLLPGYDVFDEDRYFEPGRECGVAEMHGKRIGLLICEDLWRAGDLTFIRKYDTDPVAELAQQDCDVVVALNASPFVMGKWARHVDQLRQAATTLTCGLVSVNQVGANDDLIFDGRSVAVDGDGALCAILPGWRSAVETIDLGAKAARSTTRNGIVVQPPDEIEEMSHALVLGIRDYVNKTGNESIALGLSGGIDSALVATLAAAAIGSEHVIGVSMPSRYSSPGSITDAAQLVKNLGLPEMLSVPIESLHATATAAYEQALSEELRNIADENTQARLRGIILMAISNSRRGTLVLATGNKSELATGYCTLYGDMCGALCVLGDVTKSRIYKLARWINANFAQLGFRLPPIPQASIDKPPSAELKANQTDQDTLPPYDVLDEIIVRLVEHEQSREEIVAETGLDSALVNRWVRVIDQQEYKREQAALVLKVTPRTFGRGRPMPLAAKNTMPVAVRSQPARSASEGERLRVE